MPPNKPSETVILKNTIIILLIMNDEILFTITPFFPPSSIPQLPLSCAHNSVPSKE